MSYEPIPVKAPRLAGRPCGCWPRRWRAASGAALLAPGLLKQLGLPGFRALRPSEPPTLLPWVPPAAAGRAARRHAGGAAGAGWRRRGRGRSRGGPAGVADYARAYRKGRGRARGGGPGVAGRHPRQRRGRAAAAGVRGGATRRTCWRRPGPSGERWRRGQPLSPLDGVPVAIKDELDLVALPPPAAGRGCSRPAGGRADAAVVARAAGRGRAPVRQDQHARGGHRGDRA